MSKNYARVEVDGVEMFNDCGANLFPWTEPMYLGVNRVVMSVNGEPYMKEEKDTESRAGGGVCEVCVSWGETRPFCPGNTK